MTVFVMVYIYWLLFSVVWISTILDSPVFCAATIQSTQSESRQGLLLDPFGPSYHLQHTITNTLKSFPYDSIWAIRSQISRKVLEGSHFDRLRLSGTQLSPTDWRPIALPSIKPPPPSLGRPQFWILNIFLSSLQMQPTILYFTQSRMLL